MCARANRGSVPDSLPAVLVRLSPELTAIHAPASSRVNHLSTANKDLIGATLVALSPIVGVIPARLVCTTLHFSVTSGASDVAFVAALTVTIGGAMLAATRLE